ncbi:MAG: RES family NAD+ phosphorylase [Crocosphaera sp.]|nr:RES family NAD+ phosphorylase [Crocosphaera sp.]
MTNPTNNLPGEHPYPPSDLFRRELPLKIIEARTVFYRVHQAQYDPIYFNNSSQGRFNIPEGVMYLGIDEWVAFRETIGSFSEYRLISCEELKKRRLSQVISSRNLSLVDLTGNGLTLLDADGRLSTGSYNIAQRWSQALQDHPSNPDGIYYRSRYDLARFCLALYNIRTNSILQVIKTYDFLSEEYQGRLGEILDEYQYGLIEMD